MLDMSITMPVKHRTKIRSIGFVHLGRGEQCRYPVNQRTCTRAAPSLSLHCHLRAVDHVSGRHELYFTQNMRPCMQSCSQCMVLESLNGLTADKPRRLSRFVCPAGSRRAILQVASNFLSSAFAFFRGRPYATLMQQLKPLQ